MSERQRHKLRTGGQVVLIGFNSGAAAAGAQLYGGDSFRGRSLLFLRLCDLLNLCYANANEQTLLSEDRTGGPSRWTLLGTSGPGVSAQLRKLQERS